MRPRVNLLLGFMALLTATPAEQGALTNLLMMVGESDTTRHYGRVCGEVMDPQSSFTWFDLHCWL